MAKVGWHHSEKHRPVKHIAVLLAGLLILFCSPLAMAQPVSDCPLRDAPFSIDLPLIDILSAPEAKNLLDDAINNHLEKLRQQYPQYTRATAPTFFAIMSLRNVGEQMQLSQEQLQSLDARLRALPVTDAVHSARCARYDNDVPAINLSGPGPKILIFEKITGFHHGATIPAVDKVFLELAKRHGWTIVSTDKAGAITPEILGQFDAVIWNNVSGDVLTLSQRDTLRNFITQGGGFLALHASGGDRHGGWEDYKKDMIGALFIGHIMNPQFQSARVDFSQSGHPVAKGLPRQWTVTDELYSFADNPANSGATIIATIDESSYQPDERSKGGQDLRMGVHPMVWVNHLGKGKLFYSAFGHKPELYSDPVYNRLLENALLWVVEDDPAKHGAETGDSATADK